MSIQCDYTDKYGNIIIGAIVKADRTIITTTGIATIFFVWRDTNTMGVGRPVGKIKTNMPFTVSISGTKNYIKRAYEDLLAQGSLINSSNI